MRFFSSLGLLAAVVAAKDALVLIPNADIPSRSLSLTSARHVLVQRLRLGVLDTVRPSDEETIAALNAYGGRSQQIFEQEERQPAVLIMLDNVADAKALLPSSPSLSSFVIPDTPDAASNLALARYLGGGKESRLQNEPHMNDMQRNLMEVMEGANYRFMQSGQDAYTVYLDLKQEMANSASEQASTLRKVLTSALEQAKEWDLTIALMPETSTSFFSKRSAQSNWFADLPSSGRPDLVPVANHDTNVANPPHSPSFPEDIYVSHDSQSASADSSTHKSSWLDTLYPFNSDDDTSSDSTPAWKSPVSAILASGNNTNTTAPKGILPQCFSSQSACESTTHSCSGHGSCSLKYKDSTGSGKGSCWSCSCSVSRHTNKDGTVKTTRWTGPACQKKDVSFEFWLLASVTVGLLSGIVFGVGMLMEMGSAELPSVIGSGVAGVRSKN